MKPLFKSIFILVITISLSGCSEQKTQLKDLIGLEITSDPIQNYLNNLKIDPEISRYDDVYYYIYKSKGIDFCFSSSDTLQAIFLFSESSDDHRQFQSELPLGVTFSDSRKVVEEKLGQPDISGGGNVISYWSTWREKGFSISYKNEDTLDMNNKIHHVSIDKYD